MRPSRSLLLVPLLVVAALLTAVPSAQAAGTGQIVGRLLAKPTGGAAAPYPSGGVQLYYNDTNDFFGADLVEPNPTDIADTGAFTASGLEDGWYWLRAYGGGYATEYYRNTFHYSTASAIQISGGETQYLVDDIVLEEAGAVAGRVTDAAGSPLAGATVSFFTVEGGGGLGMQTDAEGRFDTSDDQYLQLVPGTYLMEVGAWYQDLSKPVYRTKSLSVTVGAGQVTTQDVSLAERPSAVVTVLDPAGTPLPDARLSIQIRDADVNGGQWGPIQSGPHNTDATGRYRFVDGIDEVRFQVLLPEGYTGTAVPEWWEDAYSFATARSLTFPAGVALRRDLVVQLGPAPVTPPVTPPAPVGPAKLTAPRPVVRGKARVGRTLRARAGTWRPAPVALTYRWYRGAKAIPRATKATYRLTRRDAGQRISVRVTGRKTAYVTATTRSARTAKVRR